MTTNTYSELFTAISPVVINYRDDLTKHDFNMITENPGRPFVHAAYSMGTHLHWLPETLENNDTRPYLFGRCTPLETYHSILRVHHQWAAEKERVFHHYNGRTLKRITAQESHDIYKANLERVENEWNRFLQAQYRQSMRARQDRQYSEHIQRRLQQG